MYSQGLSLEQVDKMMEETNPRTSAKWRPRETYATAAGLKDGMVDISHIKEVERRGSAY